MLAPDNLLALTAPAGAVQNPDSAGAQVPGAAVSDSTETNVTATTNFGLTEIKAAHE
jgi:hypothetical protein